MKRREQWQAVLDHEVQRWSNMPYDELICVLRDQHAYEVEFDSKKYQVEIEILKSVGQSVQVMIAVDDGSLPASLSPATRVFTRNRPV
jgi:hypothetical protein